MARQCCFLCASDEGIFLDITEDNNQIFQKQFEICSLVKVPSADQLPTKLCHKCAYELNQCSSFVEKFKRTTKQKTQSKKLCCSLCHHTTKSEFIFDLNKDQSVQHNPFDKIQKVFDYDFKNIKEHHKFICLSCRYTLDVLFDLKNLSSESAVKLNDITNEKVDCVNTHKIKTTVISRKTTINEAARTNLPTLHELNSDSKAMIRTRSRNNKLDNDNESNINTKSSSCDKCKMFIKSINMTYKIPETEIILCKQCWVKSGFAKSEVENQMPSNDTKAKVCKVFLKDVLKDTKLKKQKLHKIDKNGQDEKTDVAKNKNLESKSESVSIVNTRNGVSKRRFITDVKDDNIGTNGPTQTKRSKVAAKQESDYSKKVYFATEETKQRKTSSTRNFDSDSSVLSRKSKRIVSKRKRFATSKSLSDADKDSKRNRRKLRSILEGNAVIENLDLTIDLTIDGSSSSEDVTVRKKRRIESSLQDSFKKGNKKVSKKDTSQQVSKYVSNKQSKSTRQSKTSEESRSSESDEEVVFNTTIYICDECGASYENKLLGLTHKLTHYKQPKVQLEKVKEKEILEEVAKEVSDTSEDTDEQCKDQLEAIAIRVDDDEEEPVKDTNSLIENENNMDDKVQYSKKEPMEDAVDMKLVMKESDDDCTQTERKTDEIKKTDEETADIAMTDSSAHNETEGPIQDKSNSDNNNDTYESVEKESTNTEEKQETSLTTIKDKEGEKEEEEEQEKEEKQNASPDNIEDTQEEKSEQDVDKCESRGNDNNEKEDEDNKDEDMGGKVARIERKDSSEEEVISLGIWEENEGAKDSEPQKNSNNDTVINEIDHPKEDKRNSVEKKVEENDVDVGIDKQSPECTKRKRSSKGNKNQIIEGNNTSAKPLIVEDIVLSEKSITLEKDGETDSIKRSKFDASKQEQSDCAHAAAEVLQEVINLASAEVQKRQDVTEADHEDNSNEAETVENISREIQNSGEASVVE